MKVKETDVIFQTLEVAGINFANFAKPARPHLKGSSFSTEVKQTPRNQNEMGVLLFA